FLKQFLDLRGRNAGCGGFDGDGAVAEGFQVESGGVQLLDQAREVDLLSGGPAGHPRHHELLSLRCAVGTIAQDFLEQDALVGYVLVDDPEPIGAGGTDEALADLTERAEIREGGEGVYGGTGARSLAVAALRRGRGRVERGRWSQLDRRGGR